MSLSTKILIFLGAIITMGLLGFIVYKQIEISTRQQAIEAQVVAQKELVDNIMRSQNSYATKDDIEKFIKDNGVNLKAIQDDLDKLHAEVTAVNTVVVTSAGQHTTNVPSSGTGTANPNPVDPTNPDPNGFLSKQQTLDLAEDFSGTKVPIGQVGFSAWQKDPWSVTIRPREYHVINVLGTDDNQRTYVYNKVTIKSGDQSYDVKIAQAQTEQEYPEAQWSWFNPRLHLTTGGAINLTQTPLQGSANIGATVGIMSYGQFKTTPTVSVLQIGGGYVTGTQKPSVILNPVNINIGGIFPKGLINSTYIGPSIQVDTGGNAFIGANISVGL